MKVVWSPESRLDLLKTTEFARNQWGAKIVKRYKSDLDKAIERLQMYPFMCPESDLLPGSRRCLVNYQRSLFYEVSKEEINILRIFPNKMDPDSLQIP